MYVFDLSCLVDIYGFANYDCQTDNTTLTTADFNISNVCIINKWICVKSWKKFFLYIITYLIMLKYVLPMIWFTINDEDKRLHADVCAD